MSFTPNPNKAQEPVHLSGPNVFTLHLKVNRNTNPDNSNVRGQNDTCKVDLNDSRTVLLAKTVRWRSTEEVKIEFNRDMASTKPPVKYFADTQGEFNVTPEIERVSFSLQAKRMATIYFEIA